MTSSRARCARERLGDLGPIGGAFAGLALALAYAGLALGISASESINQSGTVAASFWPASGVTVVALLFTGPRTWPWLLGGIWCAEFGVDVHSGVQMTVAAGWGLANVAEPLTSAWLLRRAGVGAPDLTRRRDLLAFLSCGVALGPAVGSLAATIVSSLNGAGNFGGAWLRWWVGDAIGVVTVAPALLAAGSQHRVVRRFPRCRSCGFLATCLLPVLFVVGCNAASGTRHVDSVVFLLIPIITWIALAGGQRTAAVSVLTAALAVNVSTAMGWGVFAEQRGAFSGLIDAQIFLAALATTSFLVAVVTHDLMRRDELDDRLRAEAQHDALTGLANRHAVFERFGGTSATAARPTGCLMIDVNDFKSINDTYGHETGDAVLVEIAHRLESAIRDDDLVARLGGDEFVVFLSGHRDRQALDALAARIADAVRQPMHVTGEVLVVAVSVGVADSSELEPNDSGVEGLMRNADAARYRMKMQPPDRYRVRRPSRE